MGHHRSALLGIFKQVPGLTIKVFAYSGQCFETDALHLARFEQREIGLCDADMVGEIARLFLALGKHDIKANNDWHMSDDLFILVGDPRCFCHQGCNDEEHDAN